MIRVSFSLFLSFSVFCYFTLLLVFINLFYYYYYFFFFFFMKIIFYFFIFKNVPECSVFRVLSTPAPSTCIRKFLYQDFFFGRIRLSSTHIRWIRHTEPQLFQSSLKCSPEWIFFNTLWIRNRAKYGYFLIRWRYKIEPSSSPWILYSRWQPGSQVLSWQSKTQTSALRSMLCCQG